jgi:hypothetical protein
MSGLSGEDQDTDGRPKILGTDISLEESYLSYREHFNALKERGLKQVDLTVSDEHKGLLRAQQEVFFPGQPTRDAAVTLCEMSCPGFPIRKDQI